MPSMFLARKIYIKRIPKAKTAWEYTICRFCWFC